METSSPSVAKILTMVLFTLSCVGLLLFLWLSFGGEVPFNPQGYRFEVAFPDAQELATEADVRIAGVSVGKVISKTLDPEGNRTLATIQLNNKYAPIRENATAILREKTILGETYVQLTPGTRSSPALPDGATLARGQVQQAVQLDTIFNALDPTTRRDFQIWQQQMATAVTGNDVNLNNVLGNLPTFAADATDILQVLNVEHNATVNLVRNGGTVFAALSQNQSALQNLITTSETVFKTTADNNNKLAQIFEVFPTFLNESKLTLAQLQTFSLNTDPVIKELIPVAQDLGPTLHAVQVLSPDLKKLFVNLNPLITVSKTGLPAVGEFLTGARPALASLGTFLEQLNPILSWLSLHQQLLGDFVSNLGAGLAATTDTAGGTGLTCGGTPCGHYLRQFSPTGTETLGLYQNRDSNNRGNTYPGPLWLDNPNNFIKGDFPAWDCNNAGGQHGPSSSEQACWVAPTLPGAAPGQIPHITQAHYTDK